jgi:precorrin-6Y C5,15-methyltransferase (decarboxylating)
MITVIGLDGGPLAAVAAKRLDEATLVAGGARHLAAVEVPVGAETVVMGNVASAVERIASHHGRAVVLASGDPGFFGIAGTLRRAGLDAEIVPAVSSVAAAFGRAGLPWDDALVVSAHGRDLRRAVNVCRAYRTVAVLTGPGAGPAELGSALDRLDRRLLVAERLGTADERVLEVSPSEAASRQWADPNVVLVLAPGHVPSAVPSGTRHERWTRTRNVPAALSGLASNAPAATDPGATDPGAIDPAATDSGAVDAGAVDPGATGPGWIAGSGPGPAGWALPEDDFEHRDSMITKYEVRALALAKLAPKLGDLVWDVGAGSGSVAVECARFGAAVIAIERDRDACQRIGANAERHAAELQIVHDTAPDALRDLPEPDAVFVGGGGPDVLAACVARQPARIVAAYASLERGSAARQALTAAGYRVDGVLLQSSRLADLPGGTTRLAATNPVLLVWGVR